MLRSYQNRTEQNRFVWIRSTITWLFTYSRLNGNTMGSWNRQTEMTTNIRIPCIHSHQKRYRKSERSSEQPGICPERQSARLNAAVVQQRHTAVTESPPAGLHTRDATNLQFHYPPRPAATPCPTTTTRKLILAEPNPQKTRNFKNLLLHEKNTAGSMLEPYKPYLLHCCAEKDSQSNSKDLKLLC